MDRLATTLAFSFTLPYCTAGSNTHNNGNPAGDGQAGDAGEGNGGEYRYETQLSTAIL